MPIRAWRVQQPQAVPGGRGPATSLPFLSNTALDARSGVGVALPDWIPAKAGRSTPCQDMPFNRVQKAVEGGLKVFR